MLETQKNMITLQILTDLLCIVAVGKLIEQ